MIKSHNILKKIKGGLIVSCQAHKGEPLYGNGIMPIMANAAKEGGAVAIRANGKDDISRIKNKVQLPVIGIKKRIYGKSEVIITPTLVEALEVVKAGADIVAFDGTNRARPNQNSLEQFIYQVKQQFPYVLLMADVSTLEEGIIAAKYGADIVATTLSGYTSYSMKCEGPDFQLIDDLSNNINVPIIAEGRISTPDEAFECLKRGAWSVVVGSAITRPQEITQKYVKKIEGKSL